MALVAITSLSDSEGGHAHVHASEIQAVLFKAFQLSLMMLCPLSPSPVFGIMGLAGEIDPSSKAAAKDWRLQGAGSLACNMSLGVWLADQNCLVASYSTVKAGLCIPQADITGHCNDNSGKVCGRMRIKSQKVVRPLVCKTILMHEWQCWTKRSRINCVEQHNALLASPMSLRLAGARGPAPNMGPARRQQKSTGRARLPRARWPHAGA